MWLLLYVSEAIDMLYICEAFDTPPIIYMWCLTPLLLYSWEATDAIPIIYMWSDWRYS